MSEQTSKKFDFPFNPISIDFVNHVIYHVAVSMREREIDPRTSVVVTELWTYRLQMMGEELKALTEVSGVAFSIIDAISFAKEKLASIRTQIDSVEDPDELRNLIIQADLEVGRISELMGDLANV